VPGKINTQIGFSIVEGIDKDADCFAKYGEEKYRIVNNEQFPVNSEQITTNSNM
jgi:hypothetical protein